MTQCNNLRVMVELTDVCAQRTQTYTTATLKQLTLYLVYYTVVLLLLAPPLCNGVEDVVLPFIFGVSLFYKVCPRMNVSAVDHKLAQEFNVGLVHPLRICEDLGHVFRNCYLEDSNVLSVMPVTGTSTY